MKDDDWVKLGESDEYPGFEDQPRHSLGVVALVLICATLTVGAAIIAVLIAVLP